MNKDKKIERLERKIAEVQSENNKLKSEVRKVKSDQRKASKKKDVKILTLNKEQQRLLSKLLDGTLTPDSL